MEQIEHIVNSSIGFENNFDCWSYRYLFYVVGMEIDETEEALNINKKMVIINKIIIRLHK